LPEEEHTSLNGCLFMEATCTVPAADPTARQQPTVSVKDIDARLIFLVSQPRAGSTMLQLMLGGHPEIHTLQEPWLMLHPLYALREGVEAEFDARLGGLALRKFLHALDGGDAVYFEALRRGMGYLYATALAQTGKQHFLDKTPRYYLILPELAKVFPRARFVILLRNPLAVLTSVMTTWVRGRLRRLHLVRDDLFRAPAMLLQGVEQLGERCCVVHYEELLQDPPHQLRRLTSFLGVSEQDNLMTYRDGCHNSWTMGDDTLTRQHANACSDNLDRWQARLADPVCWTMARDYVRWLGSETVDQLGYDYQQLQDVLRDRRPHIIRRLLSRAPFVPRPVTADHRSGVAHTNLGSKSSPSGA
jgi:hypothetical protein